MELEKFDVDMQQKVLAVMVQDRMFLAQVAELVKPSYFDSEVLVDLVRITEDYYREFGAAPTPLALSHSTKEYLLAAKKKNPSRYFDMIEDIFSDSLPEKDYITKTTIDFVQAHEIRNSLAECVDLWQNRNFSKMKQILDKSFSISEVKRSAYRYFDPEAIKERYTQNTAERLPTGYAAVDKSIDGGLLPGELGIVLAPTNVGKSIWLTLFGSNALKLRKSVLHVSLEMDKQQIGIRYDRNLTGKTKSLLAAGVDDLAEYLLGLQKSYKCDLIIEKFPTRGLSVAELKAYLNFLRLDNFVPGLMLVDYASIMKPSSKRGSRHEEIEETVEDLRGLGDEFGIPVWSAAQTKQSAVNKKRISVEDLGEAYAQAKVADVIFALCQTRSESLNDQTRLFLAKNRNGKKFQTFLFHTIYDIMRVRFEQEITDAGPSDDDDDKGKGKQK